MCQRPQKASVIASAATKQALSLSSLRATEGSAAIFTLPVIVSEVIFTLPVIARSELVSPVPSNPRGGTRERRSNLKYINLRASLFVSSAERGESRSYEYDLQITRPSTNFVTLGLCDILTFAFHIIASEAILTLPVIARDEVPRQSHFAQFTNTRILGLSFLYILDTRGTSFYTRLHSI